MALDTFDEQKEVFDLLKDKRSRLEYLHDLARDFDLIEGAEKIEMNLRTYCSSPFWIKAHLSEGKIHYSISCDAITPRGLLCLLHAIFDGVGVSDILAFDKDLSLEFAMKDYLSPTRLQSFKKMQSDFIDLARQ